MDLKPSKRWEVEVFTHKLSGQKITIHYNKDHKVFWAAIGTETVKGATQSEAKEKAIEVADRKLVHEEKWERIIIVEPSSHENQTRYGQYSRSCSFNSPTFGFRCWRAWIMETWDGKHFTRSWDRNPDREWERERIKRHEDIQPFSDYSTDSGVILNYSDQLWERLLTIGEQIGSLQQLLVQLMRSEDVEKRLLEGPALLPEVASGGGPTPVESGQPAWRPRGGSLGSENDK